MREILDKKDFPLRQKLINKINHCRTDAKSILFLLVSTLKQNSSDMRIYTMLYLCLFRFPYVVHMLYALECKTCVMSISFAVKNSFVQKN